jgi:hypothetical protein
MPHLNTAEETERVLGITDEQILYEIESVEVSDEELDKYMSDIRATLPVAIGTGGTGAYCCGVGGPNNDTCTTTTPNDVCSPSLPACA